MCIGSDPRSHVLSVLICMYPVYNVLSGLPFYLFHSLIVFFAVGGIQSLSPTLFWYPPPAPCPVHPVLSPAHCFLLCLVLQSPQTAFQLHLQFLLDHCPGGCLWKRWGPSGAGMGSTVLLRVDLKPLLQYLPRLFSASPKYIPVGPEVSRSSQAASDFVSLAAFHASK